MLDTTVLYKTKKHGTLRIYEYIDAKHVVVEFVNTGYKTVSQAGNVRTGNVRDNMLPSVCGVGFIGDGPYRSKVLGKNSPTYNAWRNMIKRCYDAKTQKKQPTYIGCEVCVDWHDFQIFSKWFEVNKIDGFVLDKDTKVIGNKLYSPETCVFISPAANSIAAAAKSHLFYNPSGVLVSVYNLTEHCRVNGLVQQNMSAVHLGKRKSHKGWVKA